MYEKRTCEMIDGIDKIEDYATRVDAFVKLLRALDMMDNRRRILVGDPEPAAARGNVNQKRAIVDLEPLRKADPPIGGL